MKPLVVIPARGGSKGVPGKNIKKLHDKPLIQYTIEAARGIFQDERIVVSTDALEIKHEVEKLGLDVPFLRPSKLSIDTAGTYSVLIHALNFVEKNGYYPDTLILLQPTSPFRNSRHIKEALQLYSNTIDMVVSVRETRANPYYVLFEEDSNGYLKPSKSGNYARRQDCPRVWEYNGGIYIINISSLRLKELNHFEKVKKYVMDDISSHDIDTKFDWSFAEFLLKANPKL
ncbi:MAG: acylneuraminate cytidylyltransferase family protein [Cyclobacteriaceae bacterium]|nr:acylneuraminate cytidylyltransferase family protein [Cyclobacteriaceae bacterium]